MAYNPFNDIASIVNAKGQYETTKANGGTGYDAYHVDAQQYYNNLINNGRQDLADALKASDYNGGLAIQKQFSPGSYVESYQDKYSDLMTSISNSLLDYQPYEWSGGPAPTYNNRYDAQINSLLNGINNYGPFSYDPETDPLYSSYKKQYTREGKRATEDAIGAAAAASGGIPSSYAVTAATQAGDYYAAQMADKVPELYQIAYNKYLQDFTQELQKLSATQGQEQYDYAKYLDQLSQYNTDRNFDYNVWSDRYNQLANNLSTVATLSDNEYSRYMDKLNLDNAYNNQAWEQAQLKAQYGDLSGLNSLGVDTSNYDPNKLDFDDKFALAKTLASLGDYSLLEELTGRKINIPEQVVTSGSGGSGGGKTTKDEPITQDMIVDAGIQALTNHGYKNYDEFLGEMKAYAKQLGITYGTSKWNTFIGLFDKAAKTAGFTNAKDWIENAEKKAEEHAREAAGNTTKVDSTKPIKGGMTGPEYSRTN